LADVPGGGRRSSTVDAHVHIFPPEVIRERASLLDRDPWFNTLYASPRAAMASAEDVIEIMDADGIDMSVVFGFAFKDQGLCRLVNDYVIQASAASQGRLAGLCCVSPKMPGAVAELERCLDAGLRGCGELAPDGQGFVDDWLPSAGPRRSSTGTGRSGMAAVAACLTERDRPLLIHSNEPVGHRYAGKGRFTPEACLAFAAAHPDLTIVLAHLGGGLFLYEAMPEVRQTLARVHYDTAAVPYLYDASVYEAVLACAGKEKLLFGSDYALLPPGRYRDGLDRLPGSARDAVLGGNARRVFHL
jgi:predicted TIM-barrel fold metal-dependent hydrolase